MPRTSGLAAVLGELLGSGDQIAADGFGEAFGANSLSNQHAQLVQTDAALGKGDLVLDHNFRQLYYLIC